MNGIKALFEPRSVAVVGASKDPNKLGYVLLKNVLDYEFKGTVYPINPSADNILGLKVYPNISALPEPVDLVLISVPSHLVLEIIEECANSGVKCAVILSSGFGEVEQCKELQDKIGAISRGSGMRVMGPNCMGIYNISCNLNGTYFWELPRVTGGISFVSQSGAYGGILFNEVRQMHIGINKFASLGNMVDITHTDIIRYLADDPSTQVIALFVESLKDGNEFMEVASSIHKPIVAFKAGRTPSGNRAASSHTGAMAGEIRVYEAAFKQCGVILAKTSEEFFDVCMALSKCSNCLPSNRNVGILTISGGPCVIASDVCEEIGLTVPKLKDEVRSLIREYIPFFGATSNPVDMTPQMNPANYEACVDVVVSQPDIGGVIAINVGLDQPEFASAFVKASNKYNKPIVSFTINTPRVTKIFRDNNIPIYPTPERAVYAYNGLVRYQEWRDETRNSRVKKINESTVLKGMRSKKSVSCYEWMKVLEEYGIPVCTGEVAHTIEEAIMVAEKIGYPVVAKVELPQVIHKTEVGGVFLNLKDRQELIVACQKIENKFGKEAKFLIQSYVPSTYELIIGGKRDTTFGAIVLIGMGGILTEVLQDISIRVCPIDKADAIKMVQDLKGYPILKGYRGRTVCDIEEVADILVRVADLLISNSEIKELDINPLVIHNNKLLAVDALICL